MSSFIFFGVGIRFNRIINEKQKLLADNNILFAVDNNTSMWNQNIHGLNVKSPDSVMDSEFDYIVITVAAPEMIYEQLINMNITQDKILLFEQFMMLDRHEESYEYGKKYHLSKEKVNLVIVAVRLAYNGGAIAVLNAAKALGLAGWNVQIAVPDADKDILDEAIHDDLSIKIMPGLNAPGSYEREWVSKFDYILINSFIMLSCVFEFQGLKPIFWWLHESSFFYPNVIQSWPQYKLENLNSSIKVLAVSSYAKRCFEEYMPNRVDGLLPIAAPDVEKACIKHQSGKYIFAFIGEILEYKGVLKIVDAFEQLPDNSFSESELWIIGRNYGDAYGDEVSVRAAKNNNVKLCGVLSQKEISKIYEEIDVLICASPEETLSMVCVDAMKYGKLCIVSRGAGVTDYLEDGENALFFNPEDVDELFNRMSWVMEHKEDARRIGVAARKAFLDNFTSEKFISQLNIYIRELQNNI